MCSVRDISVESGIDKLNSNVSFSILLELCLNFLGSVQTGSICTFLAHVQSGTTCTFFDSRVYRNYVCLFYLPLNKAEMYLFFYSPANRKYTCFLFFFFFLTLVQTGTLCTFLIMCKLGLCMPFCFLLASCKLELCVPFILDLVQNGSICGIFCYSHPNRTMCAFYFQLLCKPEQYEPFFDMINQNHVNLFLYSRANGKCVYLSNFFLSKRKNSALNILKSVNMP